MPSTPSRLVARLVALAPWLLALLLVEAAAWHMHERWHNEAQQRLVRSASEARSVLEGELNATIFLTVGLVTYIQSQQGQLDDAGITPWLRTLIEQGRHIRNIGLAPGNRITHIYPREGNEAALGLYYPDLPEQWPAVERMIQGRNPVLAGPLELRQGGRGLIYRTPVFIDGDYWGLISTVMSADSLLSVLDAFVAQRDAFISLRVHDPSRSDNASSAFWGTVPATTDAPRHSVELQLPGAIWQLTASEPNDESQAWLTRTAGWVSLAALVMVLRQSKSQRARRARAEAQMHAQEAYNSLLLDHVIDGVVSLDIQGRIVSLNPAAESMLGSPQNDALGQSISEFFPIAEADITHWLQTQSALVAPNGMIELSGALETSVPIELTVVPLTDVAGAAWLLLLRDLSERLQTERLKNEFVSIVSHELRTPLSAIAGALGLVTAGVAGPLPEKAQQLLNIAHNNTGRLHRLVNDLLDMERLSTGKLSLELAPEPLLPQLRSVIDSTASYAASFSVRTRLSDADASIASCVWIHVDATRLQQVLTNLIGNAAKFSPAGGDIELQVQCFDQYVRVAVRDHGPGVPEHFRKHIFQKFSQADASDTREKGGTGLGLSIARTLIQQMGGRLDFESPADGGACFFFELPRISPPADDECGTTPHTTPAGTAG